MDGERVRESRFTIEAGALLFGFIGLAICLSEIRGCVRDSSPIVPETETIRLLRKIESTLDRAFPEQPEASAFPPKSQEPK